MVYLNFLIRLTVLSSGSRLHHRLPCLMSTRHASLIVTLKDTRITMSLPPIFESAAILTPVLIWKQSRTVQLRGRPSRCTNWSNTHPIESIDKSASVCKDNGPNIPTHFKNHVTFVGRHNTFDKIFQRLCTCRRWHSIPHMDRHRLRPLNRLKPKWQNLVWPKRAFSWHASRWIITLMCENITCV